MRGKQGCEVEKLLQKSLRMMGKETRKNLPIKSPLLKQGALSIDCLYEKKLLNLYLNCFFILNLHLLLPLFPSVNNTKLRFQPNISYRPYIKSKKNNMNCHLPAFN
jgi:hypothetical protein